MNHEQLSYFIGFFSTDGSYYEQSRNRGKGTIELNIRDEDILYKLNEILPCYSSVKYRTRDTNFKDNTTTATLSFFDEEFREHVLFLQKNISHLDFRHYFRGVFDADGSLGFTSSGKPFVSLVAVEDEIKDQFLEIIKDLTGKIKIINRNKRDNVYNIAVFSEDAVIVASYLYGNSTIWIGRKKKLSDEILKWKRPRGKEKRKGKKQTWTKIEDEFILNNSLDDSMSQLKRSKGSIQTRLWRLKKAD